jgi:CRP-like cAMP-binding protein
VRGGSSDPKTASLLIVYSLAKALAISPLEVYEMPAELVLELLTVHSEVEIFKSEEMKRRMK